MYAPDPSPRSHFVRSSSPSGGEGKLRLTCRIENPRAFFTHHRIILERTAAIRLPAIYQWPEYVPEGGLAGYGPNLRQIFRDQIAALVAAVLRGTRPADLPVQQPTTFQFAINLGTAKALGIIIPPSILARTNEVIE